MPLDWEFHVSGCCCCCWISEHYNYLSAFVALQLSPGSEDDEGPISEKLGRIQFSIGYSFQNTTLTVKVLRGQDLPAKDFSGTSDPFVKIYLLPDKKHKLETKVKRKNLNPHWNETFLFEGLCLHTGMFSLNIFHHLFQICCHLWFDWDITAFSLIAWKNRKNYKSVMYNNQK